MIKEEFLKQYPLYTRRLDFFRAQHERGASFVDFAQKLQRMADEADLPALSVDQMMVFRYLTAVQNTELRKEFLKEKDLTKQKLLDIARQFEISNNCVKAMNEKGASSSFVKARGGGKSSSKGKTNGRHDSDRQNEKTAAFLSFGKHISNLRKSGRCVRCGKTWAENHKDHCRAGDLTCGYCERNGHSAAACYKKAKAKTSSSSSSERGRPRSRSASSNSVRRSSSQQPPKAKKAAKRVQSAPASDVSDSEDEAPVISNYTQFE